LRKLVIHERGHKCEKCGITKWLEKPVPLDLHHKNGDSLDNFLSNICLLCKNCHALTDTYGAKNMGNGRHSRRISAIKENLLK